ncbi:MAG: transposase [Deltaproteobacteria bacterium]|nr:transposase [Deltaproteobacteria bacterium]
MSKPFIHVDSKKFGDYAIIFYPSYENNTKQVITENLGRVIDLDKGIFRNRLKGLFHFDFESGYTVIEPPNCAKNDNIVFNEQGIIFGHIYVVNEVLQRVNYLDIFKNIYPGHEDSLLTLLLYRLLTNDSYINVYPWWSSSYASKLFPNASIQSQRISEHLFALGKINLQSFFNNYLQVIYNDNNIEGIVLDSTGVPNDINIDLTKINNHNGIISNEVRLIYIIDRLKKIPIYFRVVSGNIVDVSTLQNTINELKSYNVNIKYAVLDAGYYSEDNIKFLYNNNINFVARLVSNRLIAKEIIGKYFDQIINMDNHIIHNGRLLYIKKFSINLHGHNGYAYIAIDHHKRSQEIATLVNNNNSKSIKNRLTNSELEQESKLLGTFILLSSLDLDINEILPYYSSRNYIEQVFDVSKNNAMLLPLRVHSIEAVMGHILINFITVISYMKLNSMFDGTKYSAKNALFELGLLMGKVINSKIFIYEPNKSIKNYLKILNIPIPKIIDLNSNLCVNNDYFTL